MNNTGLSGLAVEDGEVVPSQSHSQDQSQSAPVPQQTKIISNTSTGIADPMDGVLTKRRRLSDFFGYKQAEKRQQVAVLDSPETQLTKYLEVINCDDFDPDEQPAVYTLPQFHDLWPLFSRLWCVPATSAPVERIFSQSGIIVRPHRARMSDDVLEMLMFLKCNK